LSVNGVCFVFKLQSEVED